MKHEETIARIKQYLILINSKDLESKALGVALIQTDDEIMHICNLNKHPEVFGPCYITGPMLRLNYLLKHPRFYNDYR